MVGRVDVLDCLPVLPEDVDPHHGLVQVGVGRLQDLVVQVLFVVQRLET